MLDYKPKEELIALIQRQESELAASHDENERLKAALKQEQATIGKLTLELAARQPLADSFVAPFDLTCVINWLENGCDPKEAAKELRIYQGRMSVPAQVAPSVTVDTQEVVDALRAYNHDEIGTVEAETLIKKWCVAHAARAVAAAVDDTRAQKAGTETMFYQMKAERDALGQAIADAALKAGMYNGEVDLSGPHLIMFAQHLGEASQPVAGELPPLPEPHPTHYRERSLTLERLEMYTDEQMREYGRLCRAAQPVQQPAAAPTQYGLAAYAQANADFRPAPVPAAGVHDAQEQIHIGTRLRRVAKAAGVTVDYGDDAFYYACAFSILGDIARTLEKPAAGAQGERERLRAEQAERVMPLIGPLLDAYEGAPKDELAGLSEGLLSCLSQINQAMVSDNWQPDRGRDAALRPADIQKLAELHFYAGEADTLDIRLQRFAMALLADHPAPSSDALLSVAVAVNELGATVIVSRHSQGVQTVIYSETHQPGEESLTVIAADPANGAQAGLSEGAAVTFQIDPEWPAGERHAWTLGYHSGLAVSIDICEGPKTLTTGDCADAIRAILSAAKKGGA